MLPSPCIVKPDPSPGHISLSCSRICCLIDHKFAPLRDLKAYSGQLFSASECLHTTEFAILPVNLNESWQDGNSQFTVSRGKITTRKLLPLTTMIMKEEIR